MIKRNSKMCISIIFLILSVSTLSIPCSSSIIVNNDELDQFQIVREGDAGIGGSEYRISQSFKPTLNTLTRVELLAEKMGIPSGMLIGFGRFTATMTVTCDEGVIGTGSGNGFILGFIIIVP